MYTDTHTHCSTVLWFTVFAIFSDMLKPDYLHFIFIKSLIFSVLTFIAASLPEIADIAGDLQIT